ncbi:MAG: methionyl-tRNA formyltransferase, partial [Candidatus Omnitrophica bacterium]|nr:methionyl-tRNA formyltransferase [Candidatus Omnitrophota bacterium]
MKKLKLFYFGSPSFSAYFLEKLLTDKTLPIEVKLVITQEDKPVGRKQILTPTPVKAVAQKYKIRVKSQMTNDKSQINSKSQISNSKNLEFVNSKLFGTCDLDLGALKNIDFALVYAYASIIPKELLELPKYGFWCIHPSLLPKYRGPSPIAFALINGEKETGTTIFQMDEKIDHGPIIIQEKLEILPDDKRPDLEKRLTDLAFEMFKKLVMGEAINFLRFRGVGVPTASKNFVAKPLKEQNHKQATYTRLLKKQ